MFLPNDRAQEPQIAAAYQRFGLNARQIEILSRAIPKRDYYCQSRQGNRLFELGLGIGDDHGLQTQEARVGGDPIERHVAPELLPSQDGLQLLDQQW